MTPPRHTTTVEEARVPMRDGVVLVADVYRPPSRRHPVIVLRTPYDRHGLRDRILELDPLLAIREGFVFVIQDLRGRHGSGGAFVANMNDVEDGADTIAWARSQPWSDGNVMMAGCSYNGCVQFQAARTHPEGLVAIAPTVSGAVRSIMYPGGAARMGTMEAWATILIREALDRDELAAADRGELEALLDASALERFHAFLEPDSVAHRIGAPLRHWIERPASDPYWTEITAVPPDPLPAIFTSGTYDVCLPAAVEAYEAWSARADPDTPQLLTLGPWGHDLVATEHPDLGLRNGRVPNPLMIQRRQIAFFKSVLEGTPGADMAPVMSFVLGRNTWHEDTRWPLPGLRPLILTLTDGVDGGGGLARATLPEQATVSYRYDPHDPAPINDSADWYVKGPREQGRVEARADVLKFTSARFAAELEIAGAPRATLLVASSAPATDFVARLTLVPRDGRSLTLAEGNWSGRIPDLPAVGGSRGLRRCEIGLSPLHIAIAPGARVRLQITSSSFPDLYPNPNTGHDLALGPPPRVVVAEQTVLVGAGGSTLELPVLGEIPLEVAA